MNTIVKVVKEKKNMRSKYELGEEEGIFAPNSNLGFVFKTSFRI